MTTLRPFRLALLACLLTSFVALPAQEPAAPPSARPNGQSSPAPVPTLNLVFAGGTFGELCSQLVDAGRSTWAHAKVNIVIDREATKAEVPPFEVQGAELAQILEAACAAGSRPELLLTVEDRRGSAASIHVVTAHQIVQAPGTAVAREATAVHSLAALLKDDARGIGFAPATILSAIETATIEQPLRALRYHTDSRLLIARGTKESLTVVAEVLRELEQDVRRQAQLRKPGQPAPAESTGGPVGPSKDPAETR